MQRNYGVGFDWPLTYDDIEPWYVDAEYEMGVAGSDEESNAYYQRHFGAYRSKSYPMPALVPSYLANVNPLSWQDLFASVIALGACPS